MGERTVISTYTGKLDIFFKNKERKGKREREEEREQKKEREIKEERKRKKKREGEKGRPQKLFHLNPGTIFKF